MMSRRATEWGFAAMALSVVGVFALWTYPGFLSTVPQRPIRRTQNGHRHRAESVAVEERTGASCGSSPLPAPVFRFQGAQFQISFDGTAGLARLTGPVTEAAATRYSFSLFADSLGPPPDNRSSPDAGVIVD